MQPEACRLCCSPAQALPIMNNMHFWSCSCCGLVFKDPADFPERSFEHDRYAQHNNSPDDERYIAFLRRLADPMLKYVRPGEKGLDYGSGPGPALHLIFERAGYVMKHFDPCFHPDPEVLQQMYDFCVSSETVEHFHFPKREFRTLHGLIKKGGHIGIMTQMLTENVDLASWWYPKDPTHVCFYRPETFHYLADVYGWKIQLISDSLMIAEIV